MTNQRTDKADRRGRWVVATCVALVLAAVGDAGPEIAFVAAWLQMLSFGAAIVCGTAAVRWRRAGSAVGTG